jgi:hypothetical protein
VPALPPAAPWCGWSLHRRRLSRRMLLSIVAPGPDRPEWKSLNRRVWRLLPSFTGRLAARPFIPRCWPCQPQARRAPERAGPPTGITAFYTQTVSLGLIVNLQERSEQTTRQKAFKSGRRSVGSASKAGSWKECLCCGMLQRLHLSWCATALTRPSRMLMPASWMPAGDTANTFGSAVSDRSRPDGRFGLNGGTYCLAWQRP